MDSDLVTLVVESKSYEVSKKKLSESSGYFTAMFNSDFAEKNESVIKLEGVSITSWENILHYLYHGRLKEFSKGSLIEEMLDLLEAATMFQFIDVQESCSKILFDALDVSNAMQILETASRLDLSVLIDKARAIALWNFDDVTKLDGFYKLNADQVEGYLSDPALHSWTGEWGVWEAIDRWINSPVDITQSRTEFLPKLIKCLRLESLSFSDLKCIALYDSVVNSPVVLESVRRLIKTRAAAGQTSRTTLENQEEVENQEIIENQIESDQDSDSVSAFIVDWEKTEGRKLPLVPSVVANVYIDPNTVSPYVVRFHETEKKFIPLLRLNKVENSLGSMVGFKVIADGSKLYMLGGEMMTRQSAWNNAVWMYDQIHKSWSFLSNLLNPARHLSACCLGDDLYVIGGFGRHRVVQDSVSKLCLKNKVWTSCAPLPRPVYSVPCCVFRSQIYVIESLIYQYIPSRDVWITLEVFPSAKGFSNAMATDDYIYLSGAYTKSVYKFDPCNSTVQLELVGTFKNECIQSCLIDDYIYSLSQDEFGEEIYCEKLNVKTGENIVLWEGTTDSKIADLGHKHRHGCFPLLLY